MVFSHTSYVNTPSALGTKKPLGPDGIHTKKPLGPDGIHTKKPLGPDGIHTEKPSPATPSPAPPGPGPAPAPTSPNWTCIVTTSSGTPEEVCYSPGQKLQSCVNMCLLEHGDTANVVQEYTCNEKKATFTCTGDADLCTKINAKIKWGDIGAHMTDICPAK